MTWNKHTRKLLRHAVNPLCLW